MTRILGVDPGVSGALACLDTETDPSFVVAIHDMPHISVRRASKLRHEIVEAQIARLIIDMRPNVAWIEQVHSMPKQGVASSFNFGLAYGLVRGVIAALDIPTFLIAPNVWKREFRLGSDKQQARVVASRLFPDHANAFSRIRDHGRAEAVLLCLFGSKHPL